MLSVSSLFVWNFSLCSRAFAHLVRCPVRSFQCWAFAHSLSLLTRAPRAAVAIINALAELMGRPGVARELLPPASAALAVITPAFVRLFSVLNAMSDEDAADWCASLAARVVLAAVLAVLVAVPRICNLCSRAGAARSQFAFGHDGARARCHAQLHAAHG